jgi:hypothetical protein
VGSLQHKQRIHCAVFAADEYVVCGGDDKYIYVWKTDGTYVLHGARLSGGYFHRILNTLMANRQAGRQGHARGHHCAHQVNAGRVRAGRG